MQYTASNSNAGQYKNEQFDLQITDLYQAFTTVIDPRRAQGRVYWLPSLLCLAVASILCNCLSVLAIAEWACGLSKELRHSLGLPIERIQELDARIEGWIAGLQLAALSMQHRPDPAGLIADLANAIVLGVSPDTVDSRRRFRTCLLQAKRRCHRGQTSKIVRCTFFPDCNSPAR